jgi:hypothetical protein
MDSKLNQWKNVTKHNLHNDINMTPCIVANRYQFLKEISCLHLQGKMTMFYIFNLSTEATRRSEKSVPIYRTTWYTRRCT